MVPPTTIEQSRQKIEQLSSHNEQLSAENEQLRGVVDKLQDEHEQLQAQLIAEAGKSQQLVQQQVYEKWLAGDDMP